MRSRASAAASRRSPRCSAPRLRPPDLHGGRCRPPLQRHPHGISNRTPSTAGTASSPASPARPARKANAPALPATRAAAMSVRTGERPAELRRLRAAVRRWARRAAAALAPTSRRATRAAERVATHAAANGGVQGRVCARHARRTSRVCGGQCVALDTDYRNCGILRQQLLGGHRSSSECIAGRCLRKIGTFAAATPDRAARGRRAWLYFTTGSSIRRHAGGGWARVHRRRPPGARSVMDSTNVYGIDSQGQVVGQAKAGGQPFVVGSVPGGQQPRCHRRPIRLRRGLPLAHRQEVRRGLPVLSLAHALSARSLRTGCMPTTWMGKESSVCPHSGATPERIAMGSPTARRSGHSAA